MPEKIVIGLTGNIATGKSLVLRMLQELGATTIDADKLVHQLMEQGKPVHQAIVQEFGRFVVADNGQIDRRRLGKLVFSLPEALSRLEELTHPAVRREILKRIEAADTPVVAIEAIKLFESGLVDHCQAAWVVLSPPEVQLRRLVERRKMAPDQARQRIHAQSSPREKEAKADLVVKNGGDLARTWHFVKKHYLALVEEKIGQAAAPVQTTAEATAPVRQTTFDPTQIKPSALEIRRAKRPDLEAMAEVVALGTNGSLKPDVSQMMESLFSRAYLVALADGHVVGMAGWQTENLVAGLLDFYVAHQSLWPVVGKKMLDRIHEEINSLSCEVSLSFVLEQGGPEVVKFFENEDYEQTESKDLGYIWKDIAQEWQPENSVLLYKKLREHRIMVPM